MSTRPSVEHSHSVDSRLCLALHAAARSMDTAYRGLLEPIGLTYPQYLVMSLLWESDAQRASALARQLTLDPSTLSPLVRRLEDRGLVSRHREATDDRVVIVSLTTAGDSLREEARGVPADICAASGLPHADQTELVERLHALAGVLSERA